jgi:hypothetical protein
MLTREGVCVSVCGKRALRLRAGMFTLLVTGVSVGVVGLGWINQLSPGIWHGTVTRDHAVIDPREYANVTYSIRFVFISRQITIIIYIYIN